MEDTQGTVEQHHQPSETLKKAISLVGGRLATLPESRVLRSEKTYPVNLKQICDGEATCPGEGCPHEIAVEAKQYEPPTPGVPYIQRDGTTGEERTVVFDENGKAHPSVAETMAEDALKPKDKPLTETQFRALRRAFFTVRHIEIPECGHKIDQINQPKNNCEYCWWAFFSGHGELVQVTDRAFQEQGSDFLDKMRGVKYRKYFVRYMSTLARFQKEAAERAEKEKLNGSNEGSEGEVREDQQSGQGDGREVRTDGDVPVSGEEGRQTDSVNTDGISDSR